MTRIVTDTTSGLDLELTRQLGIPNIPQVILFDEESYREGVEIDRATFMRRLTTGRVAPKTSAPYPGDFIETFTELTRNGESVVCIHPSADVSGTVRSAETAKADFPEADIRIIDTRTIAGPLASMVLEADRLAKTGASADAVEAHVRAMIPRARVYFLVDTLEYLRRGGRIGGAQALLGSILQIKPILTFTGGRVEPFEKARTKQRALARLKEIILGEAARGSDAHLTVMHTAVPDEAATLASELKATLQTDDVPIHHMVPAIVTHAGPGALAVGFFAPK